MSYVFWLWTRFSDANVFLSALFKKLLPSLRARRMCNAAHLSPQQLYSLPRCARRVFITPRFFKYGGNE